MVAAAGKPPGGAGGGVNALCLALVGGPLLASIPADGFTLAWTHSVEHTEWREEWRIDGGRLHLTAARVKGGGAGVEPPPESRLEGGWVVWRPHLPPQERVVLAASSYTQEHRLCIDDACRPLRAWLGSGGEGPIELRACS